MAELIIHTQNIKDNILKLSKYFKQNNIDWSLITKVFSGDKEFLRALLTDEIIENIGSVGDSRLLSLKNIKEVNPEINTIYIKPPAKIYVDKVVKYADISLNTSLDTIKALNQAAKKINKIHKIIIMIEMGELREGVKRADILNFYEHVFNLSNIEVIGIGSNLGCMYGIRPSYDKMLQLSLFKELISAKFNRELEYVSGGSSITLPMIENSNIPKDINHFRVGEAIFFGRSPYNNEPFMDLSTNTFEFTANIIELAKKKVVPDGVITEANIGLTADFDKDDLSENYKAILDFGILDVDKENIEPIDKSISFVGITSDMMVVDIDDNKDKNGNKKYKPGDKVHFKPSYMAVARLLNSKFIEKKFQ